MEGNMRPGPIGWASGLVRFLVGSSLLMIGSMIGLSAAITVVGLPIGVAVVGVGLQLMMGRSGR